MEGGWYCTFQAYSSDVLSVWVVVVVVVIVVLAATSGGIKLMFYTIHTDTHFNYLKYEAVLYIGKFNFHLTESNLSLLQKPVSQSVNAV